VVVPGDANSSLACVDGNWDGLITVNDITQIGQNLGNNVTEHHVYTSASEGDYPASAAGGNGGATLLGEENQPPVGALSADPTAGDVPLTVEFDASLSDDPDGYSAKYECD
jgi:PKD repeat protein